MLATLLAAVLPLDPVALESKTVSIGAKHLKVDFVRVRLAEVRMQVGLARDRIGPTEPLAALAKRKGAIAAINGSFFDAYVDRAIKCPHHTVITAGQAVHIGNVGSLIGFRNDSSGVIGRLELSIVGLREGSDQWPNRWFAYWLNRFPTAATATIFTPAWGTTTGLEGGRQIVVDGGVVTSVGPGPKAIPPAGFVLYLNGVQDSSFDRIALRSKLSYRVVNKAQASGDWGAFRAVREAVGAGPTLLRNGEIALNPESEGFSSPKILTGGGARSLAGLTANGELILAVSSGTLADMARLMKALGCLDAINLDGGASSGLFFKGKAVRTPGREISNALLVMPKNG